MLQNEELFYEIALTQFDGIGLLRAHTLLTHFESAKDIFLADADILRSIGPCGESLLNDTLRSDAFRTAEREMEFIARNNINAITYTSDAYPVRMRDCPDAPAVLFTLGNMPLNNPHMVAVVGTRHATPYGKDLTADFVSGLASADHNIVIVSGLAYGIDIASHRAALEAGLPTAAVLAHGLDRIYPNLHRPDAAKMVETNGCIITEFLSGTQPLAPNFLQRNRIVAGMCDAVVVVESDYKGGSLATARLAADYHRDVFSFPGRTSDQYSSGCNRLICDHKAEMILSANDFLKKMNWAPASQPELSFSDTPKLTGNQQIIFDTLLEQGAMQINELSARTDIPFAILSATLTEMVFDDIVCQQPGDRYELDYKFRKK